MDKNYEQMHFDDYGIPYIHRQAGMGRKPRPGDRVRMVDCPKLREDNAALRSAICVFCKENSRLEGLISGCQRCRYREVKSSDSD